jgi:hypothetical protein
VFIEYAHCMSWCPDTCVNVHLLLARNDFNSSDCCSTDSGGLDFTCSLA